jgi:hypothetical protein
MPNGWNGGSGDVATDTVPAYETDAESIVSTPATTMTVASRPLM